MDSVIFSPFPTRNFCGRCDSGQQNGAGGKIGRINSASCRVNLRRSRWDGEKVKKASMEKLLEGGSKKPGWAGLVNANVSEIKSGNRPNVAVLMEIDGVLADVHRYGHRQGFNMAFQELGLDCAQWNEAIYADLMRAAGGVEEKMLSSFFTRIGWPTALPTNEQETFIRKVLQVKLLALEKLVGSDGVPLRPGLANFVDEVLEADVPLVILGAYYKGGEQLPRMLVEKLGQERISRIRFVGEADVKNSMYGQLILGEGASSSLDEQLAVAASRGVLAEKRRIAEELAPLLKFSIGIDPSITPVSEKAIAALRAGAEIGEMDVDHCILLASGLSGSLAANRIGMPCIVVRSSLTLRAEFPAAKAAFDGYGPGSTTLPRLLKYI